MNEAGRSVPASVSIVGFDDSPAAAFYSPALTTVRLDFRALGGTCFAKLLTILGRQPGTANAKAQRRGWWSGKVPAHRHRRGTW